jgi:hypothetical protein
MARDEHGYGFGYKPVNPDPNPQNPSPNPRVYGLLTGRRLAHAGGDPCLGNSWHEILDENLDSWSEF